MTTLVEWFTGTSSAEEDEAFEERLFNEAELAAQATHLVNVRDALRALAAEGAMVPVVVEAELRALATRAKITEHHPRDARIESHITDEEFIAAHVPVPASTSTQPMRVHVEFCTPEGFAYFRVNEAPFDPASGEIVVLCKSHVARNAGELRVRVVDDDARVLADVTIVNIV